MAKFSYSGRDEKGQLVEGDIEGADTDAIAAELMRLGISPINIAEKSETQEEMPGWLRRFNEKPITASDILLFSRQINILLKAGVPIMNALKGLEASSPEKSTFARVMRELREGLEGGIDLSTCLSRHPKVFDAFYVAMVRVGEFTGRLQEVFLRLFHYIEFEKFMRDQVKSAIRYPIFVIVTMGVAISIINVFVIPTFAKAYAGFKAELPAITKGLIAFSNFTVSYWPLLLFGVVAAAFGFRAWVRSPGGKLVWDEKKLKLPIAGPIILNATIARFARSFALAVRSGVPAVQALSIVAGTLDNEYMRRRIDVIREGVERGESLRRAAASSGIFTPLVMQMLAVGEEAGELDEMMTEIADYYQRDVEFSLKNLSSQIEPILIVGLGILVLILALGVFLPIWDLGTAAMHRK